MRVYGKEFFVVILVLFLTSAGYTDARAATDSVATFQIYGSPVSGIPIAIPDFVPAEGSSPSTARQVSSIVNDDLRFMDDFYVLEEMRYPGTFDRMPVDPLKIPFTEWAQVGARYLVHGVFVEDKSAGTIRVRWRLFETRGRRQIVGYEYRGKREYLRKIAHRIADDVVRTLTGKQGIGQTKLAFICSINGVKDLWISDWDGSNPVRLTDDKSIVLFPDWSPDGKSIAFTSYRDYNPDLYSIEVKTGALTRLSRFQGVNMAPAWSPDRNKLAFVISKDGNNEIYLKDLAKGTIKRLTRNSALDSSPTFSPDGRQIAFVSTRGGSPQIWVMSVDGTDVRRLSYQGGNSYDPAWSPKGDQIAYVVEKSGDGFEIYVMDVNGRNAERLTDSSGTNESPSWAPDGKHLAFCSSRTGRNEVFVMKSDGTDKRLVTRLPGPCSNPDWSSYFLAGK